MEKSIEKFEPVVLVIDDDVEITEFLKALLKTEIHQVIISHEGITGLEKAKKHKPDVILLNVNLPNVKGYDVCRELKDDETTKYIPIIMMSGDSNPEVKEECFDAGADEFIAKPFDPIELVTRINSMLNLSRLEGQLKEAQRQLKKEELF